MTKLDLAADILEDLLNNGMINLEYGQVFWEEGKQECIKAIKDKLDRYVIIEGKVVD